MNLTSAIGPIRVVTEQVGGHYDTYLHSLETKRTYSLGITASGVWEAAENHQRLTRVVREVLYQRARVYADSLQPQLSLFYE